MLARYIGMSAKSQSYLFSFGLLLTLLGMVLTNMWLPMVIGAIIMAGLTVEAWIRVAYIIPLHDELRSMQQQLKKLQADIRSIEYQE
ncbi:hypothetical protein EXA23_14660 [Vibrio cincinnatiensis]|jgi:hypothetical protein|uniref:NADH dehydrogenase n=1 Tax=Vibrio cincinnatiensis DSM 19608 TaxID=1123491 RepID=A0A1T4SB40_VIBCI|nr:hypothetical protein [Vibrio cincinnatiensis]MCG3723642.1 hypothetical protein [Vibrio cincinnatiensis]MCG3726714.1 hypothetical protein [Vibrio cincinnatiensis]MCG3733864.1 hypothetical protein [Vibrio cincinnatiensis]MCG3737447.1 hypothetical protein [Vibrio cincinnatiensis]MCG3741048.1 hypothetical protein [Vibrio cincinnatiensis]